MKSRRIFFRLLLVLLLLVLVLAITGAGGLLQPIVILFLGWFAFLARVLPQVTIGWSGIGMVFVCSVLVLLGIQWLCQWLYAHWVRQGSADADVRWRWTWSASLYGAVWLLFLAAMGVTGVVHQVGWLAANKEPLYVERGPRAVTRYNLRIAVLDITMAGQEDEWKLAETRRAFESTQPGGSRRPNAIEDLHVLYCEGPPGKLAAAILFYRDPKKQEQLGFTLVCPDKPPEEFNMDQLQTILARYAN